MMLLFLHKTSMPEGFQDRVREAVIGQHPLATELFCAWTTAGLPWTLAEELTARQLWAHSYALDQETASA